MQQRASAANVSRCMLSSANFLTGPSVRLTEIVVIKVDLDLTHEYTVSKKALQAASVHSKRELTDSSTKL
jgi:hypothetical protein